MTDKKIICIGCGIVPNDLQFDRGRETDKGFECDECAASADIDNACPEEIILCANCGENLYAETCDYSDFPIAYCRDVKGCEQRAALLQAKAA